MMIIETKFEIGSMVYLKSDKDQTARIINELLVSRNGIMYRLMAGSSGSWHYDYEITEDVNVLTTSTH